MGSFCLRIPPTSNALSCGCLTFNPSCTHTVHHTHTHPHIYTHTLSVSITLAEASAAVLTSKPELKAARRAVEKKITMWVSQVSGTQQQVKAKAMQLVEVRLLESGWWSGRGLLACFEGLFGACLLREGVQQKGEGALYWDAELTYYT